jgi:hypothetical protein
MANEGDPLAERRGVLLKIAIGRAYDEGLRPEISRYLELRHEAGKGGTPSHVLVDIHDALKNSVNHFSKCCLADVAGEMDRHIRLGGWHLNHARILTLMPTIDILEEMVSLLSWYLSDRAKAIEHHTLREIHNLSLLHIDVDRSAQRDISGEDPADNPGPPSVGDTEKLAVLVGKMVQVADEYQKIARSLKTQHPDTPSVADILSEMARKESKKKQKRRKIQLGVALIAMVILISSAYLASTGRYYEALFALVASLAGIGEAVFGHYIYDILFGHKANTLPWQPPFA